MGQSGLDAILRSPQIGAEWWEAERMIETPFAGLQSSGACNVGDRRALFYLVRYFKPRRVLEIGSNVGGSTLAMAVALRMNMDDGESPNTMITIDKADVNAIWHDGPRNRIASVGMAESVSFVVSDSGAYFNGEVGPFDFIFIDADHDEPAVYRDIVGALRCLDASGLIVLHDYFPEARPLWSNGKVIPGPYRAVERLRREGHDFAPIPLAALPWPTKLGSNISSLAVLNVQAISSAAFDSRRHAT